MGASQAQMTAVQNVASGNTYAVSGSTNCYCTNIGREVIKKNRRKKKRKEKGNTQRSFQYNNKDGTTGI
jgi:hypothetical protein